MKRVRTSVIAFAIAHAVFGTSLAGADAGSGISDAASLVVRAHDGLEAIDVSGRGPSNRPMKITLLETLSVDLPDVVLKRISVASGADGHFSATISIAPGFTRGGIITVYALSADDSFAAKARFLPDAPNRGVTVPLEQLPRDVR